MVTASKNDDTRSATTGLTPTAGTLPAAEELLLGALLYGDTTGVLALVVDDDLGDPGAAAVFATIRTVDARGTVAPALVLDELLRAGAATAPARRVLIAAATSGAVPEAARDYAAAVVAAALRRHTESLGNALVQVAADGAESDLAALVANGAQRCADIARRLIALRGDAL